ncbi:amino acid adenylation domain-containing protein [Streptomyces sp. NPDC046866]|uniref:amino acid adenylation domain-containing protein n=1 Tax=Streptomyces sp. NPDC046866 TaxID=3154921 RepID=UPI0034536FC1
MNTPNSPLHRRPVSPTERLYLAAGQARGAMALRIVVEGDGVPDPQLLRAAVARAAESCPGSRLRRRGALWTADGPLPRIVYAPEAAGGFDPSDPQTARLLTGRAHPDAAPGCEVLVVPGAGGARTTLVFSASHAVMDGHGALTWVREVHRALRGEPARPAAAPATDHSLLHALRGERTRRAAVDPPAAHGRFPTLRDAFGRLLGRTAPGPATGSGAGVGTAASTGPGTGTGGSVNAVNAPGPRRPAPFPGRPSPLGRGTAGAAPQTLWLRRTLPGRHPGLTARLAQALADTARLDTRVMVPVDLRRHRPQLAATGNLTLPLFLDLRPGQDWAAAHTRLLAALADGGELAAGFEAGLARLPLPAVAALLRTAQAAAVRTDRHLASAVVSHLGRLDPAELSGGGFTAATAYALPVHAPLVPLSFAAAETGTRTELTLGVRACDPLLRPRAEALLDAVLARLTTDMEPPLDGSRLPQPAALRPRGGGAPVPAEEDRPEAPAAAQRPHAPQERQPPTGPEGPRAAAGEPAAPAGPEAAPPPDGVTVVDLFRAQAARTPDALALDGPGGTLAYAALDRRSDEVAAELGRRGVRRGDLVGLVVDRTPAGVCALWGVLKAGAAYVPLDPAHPGARIRDVLHGCAARLTLTRRHLAAQLAPFVPGELLAVDDVPTLPALPGPARTTPAPAPGDLAYVMHTSGSTGRPKGVLVEHRGLSAFVRWMTALCRVGEGTRFGFAASYAFDISCFPLFLPLLAGGTAVLAPDAPSPAVLRALVREHRVDTLALTPSHLALLGGDGGGRLRTLLLGGEELTPAAVRSAYAAFGTACRVINGYGPTEATVACLAHVVDDTETGPSLPLGTPGPGTRVDLVTEDGETIGTGPADTGRTGEIVVRGVQVARGYLGPCDGEADAASPFATGPDGVRTYRTGDLGRRLPGGAVAFAGRADGQVKIAGHRIEPAEVTAALEALPGVARAAVTVRRRPPSGSRSGPPPAAVLVAYAVTATATTATTARTGTGTGTADATGTAGAEVEAATADALRTALARRLPAHLVPAHVVTVDALPTTVSGKTDFDALPDPFAAAPDTLPPAGPPQGPAELRARVAGHWAAVLGVDPAALGADSDFQALGGDSLALVEMLSAVSADLLTPDQARRFTEDLACLVRDLTLGQVCSRLTAAREEAPA